MDNSEHPSINGGDWPNQVAGRPPELADWTSIKHIGATILVPTKIDPLHTRLFIFDVRLRHQIISSQTAKDALLVSQYPGTDKQFQKMVGGARYTLQYGSVIQAIDAWNVSSDQPLGGVLEWKVFGECEPRSIFAITSRYLPTLRAISAGYEATALKP